MSAGDVVWVFSGSTNHFPSAVFSSKELAEEWITRNHLTGTLSAYPLNEGAYDWAIRNEYFTPEKDHQKSPEFIANFSSASQEHYHYVDGNP